MKSEMMKAFANCVFHEDECEQCPYFKYEDCTEKLTQDLDNLINNLQTENERLNKEVETEIDKLNAEKNDVMYYKAQIKAEAYKECIEKVNERIAVTTFTNKSEEYSNGFYDAIAWVDGEIDNLFDELVGEDNG